MLEGDERAAVCAEAARRDDVIPLSALTGEGVDQFRRAVAEWLSKGSRTRVVEVDAHDGGAIAWLHQHGEVVGQELEGDRISIEVRLSDIDWARYQARS
jgi:GTP-binding protein HflX